MNENVCFIVDTMLGTLAKWLRILGFDTLYEAGMDDDIILKLATENGRIIISRDRELCSRKPDSIMLKTTDLDEQIRLVLDIYSADRNKNLSRCLDCNILLQKVPGSEVDGAAVPAEVHARYQEFWHCEKCNKYYWSGSHFDDMRKRAEILTGQALS